LLLVYRHGMPKRSRKQRLPDPNLTAFGIVQAISGEPAPEPTPPPADGKDPAAVALGRKGGLKGGKARAAKLTKAQRVASAKKAAAARWGKKAAGR
jgi:hypothetical protein